MTNNSYDYRQDFPLLMQDRTIYIDNAATSQRPQSVIDAEMDFYRNHNANPLRGSYPLSVEATDIYENARVTVKNFINASSTEEIIFTRNTTEGLNLVAYSYGLTNISAGDEIVVSIMEHHSNLLPWQMVSRQTGAALKFIECEQDGSVDLDKVAALITDKTKLVAMTHVSNVLGRENPIAEVAALAHAKGAVMVVDGAQSTPHMAIDVRALGADFFAFSGHKLMGPMGIGVLYGKESILKNMQPFLTGGEMINSVTRDGATYAELPHKFEAGTVNAAGAVGLAAAIKYINEIGFDYIQQKEEKLTKIAINGLKGHKYIHILGSDDYKNHTGIAAFTIDGVHPHDVSEILSSDGIDVRAGHHCAQPLLTFLGVNNATRASFMFYNTEKEAEAFVESVLNIRRRMGYDE